MRGSRERIISNPQRESTEKFAEPKSKKPIKGLHDVKDLKQITPDQLWIDGGIPFPKVLLVKFKRFTDTCALIKEMDRE